MAGRTTTTTKIALSYYLGIGDEVILLEERSGRIAYIPSKIRRYGRGICGLLLGRSAETHWLAYYANKIRGGGLCSALQQRGRGRVDLVDDEFCEFFEEVGSSRKKKEIRGVPNNSFLKFLFIWPEFLQLPTVALNHLFGQNWCMMARWKRRGASDEHTSKNELHRPRCSRVMPI